MVLVQIQEFVQKLKNWGVGYVHKIITITGFSEIKHNEPYIIHI